MDFNPLSVNHAETDTNYILSCLVFRSLMLASRTWAVAFVSFALLGSLTLL